MLEADSDEVAVLICFRCGVTVASDESVCGNCGADLKKKTQKKAGVSKPNSLLTTRREPSVDQIPYLVGEILCDRYELLDLVGEGALSTVYRCLDRETNEEVALRVFSPLLFEEPQLRQHNTALLEAACGLRHPNLVATLGIDRHGDNVLLTQRLLVGITLDKLIGRRQARNEVFQLRDVVPLVEQILDALEYLKDHGMTASIEPKRVVILPDMLKLTGYTVLDRPEGHPRRRSPFLAQDAPDSEAESCYALATLLVDMLCGKSPDKGQAPSSLAPNLPDGIDQFYADARQFDDKLRTFASFRERLNELLGNEAQLLPPPPPDLEAQTELEESPETASTPTPPPPPAAAIGMAPPPPPPVDEQEPPAAPVESGGPPASPPESDLDGQDEDDPDEGWDVPAVAANEQVDPEPEEDEHDEVELEPITSPSIQQIPDPLKARVATPITPPTPEDATAGADLALEPEHKAPIAAAAVVHSAAQHPAHHHSPMPLLVTIGAVIVAIIALAAYLFVTQYQPDPAPGPPKRKKVVKRIGVDTSSTQDVGTPDVGTSDVGMSDVGRPDLTPSQTVRTVVRVTPDASVGPTNVADSSTPVPDLKKSPDLVADTTPNKDLTSQDVAPVPDLQRDVVPDRVVDTALDTSTADLKKPTVVADVSSVDVVPVLTLEQLKKYKCKTGLRRIIAPPRRGKPAWGFCIEVCEYPGCGSRPRTMVSLKRAKSLCRKRKRRLCTWREWRRGCGGTYPYGRTYDPTRCNTLDKNGAPRPVTTSGKFRRCRSPYGLFDMSGNVSEWTSNGWVNGGRSTRDGASRSRCGSHSRRSPGSTSSDVGFRCCADLQPPSN